ncbi:hypothetical protein D3C84_453010 [compost metagenome]
MSSRTNNGGSSAADGSVSTSSGQTESDYAKHYNQTHNFVQIIRLHSYKCLIAFNTTNIDAEIY